MKLATLNDGSRDGKLVVVPADAREGASLLLISRRVILA